MKVFSVFLYQLSFLLLSVARGDLIISEVVDATLNGGLPKFIELTNCGSTTVNLGDYAVQNFNNGVTAASGTQTLTGSLQAGESFVISYENKDEVAFSTFHAVYGFDANERTPGAVINGDDAIALVLLGADDEPVIVDVYGDIGTDGSGELWDYEDSYSYRKPGIQGPSITFDPAEWNVAGAGSLVGATAEEIANQTSPGTHVCQQGGVFGTSGSGASPSRPPSASTPSTNSTPVAMPVAMPNAPTATSAATTIPEIQGSGTRSSFDGQPVMGVMGIVTAVGNKTFYVQDPDGDGDDTTSDAIVVFTGGVNKNVSVGDLVSVSGTVTEYTPGGKATNNLSVTQIGNNPTVTIVSSNNTLPDPILIGGTGRIPPTESLADAVTFFAALEAMRVTLVTPVAVAGTNGYGEIFTVVDGGADATGLSIRGTLNIGPNNFNPERVQIDTDDTISSGIDTQNVTTGTVLSDVTGVLGYNFGNFEVIPTKPFSVVTASLLQPTTTTLSGDESSLLIGTYNVLNLDPNENDGDTDLADGRFKANAQIIAVHMNRPDVVALQEIQDNTGASDDGTVSAQQTLAALVAAISDIDPNLKYEFIDNTFIGDNKSGGEPGANIRTAYLYNPARISVDKPSLNTVVDPTEQQRDSANPFHGSRLPLAAKFTFLATGFVFEMVNNHWSAKGGSAASMGTRQPFEELQEDPSVNGSLQKRKAQSAAILAYVRGKDNVIVLGDLNEFEFVSPVASLSAEMTLLTETIDKDERYSYMFQGNSQALDHILVSVGIDAVAEYVHVNSEFPDGPAKASDHDPMVALIHVPTMVESPTGGSSSSSSSPKPPTPPAAAGSPTKSAAPPTETPPTDGSVSFSSGRRRNDHLWVTTMVVAVAAAAAIVVSAGMVL